jgi:hypothetical protein
MEQPQMEQLEAKEAVPQFMQVFSVQVAAEEIDTH